MKAAKNCGAYATVVWNVLWKHVFLQKSSLRFKENILHEDLLFSFQAFMAASRVLPIPDVFYHYRARLGAITTKAVLPQNVAGSFLCAEAVLKYALADSYEPDREHEIWRAYTGITEHTYACYAALPADAQRNMLLPREIENELLKQMLSCYQVNSLQAAVGVLQAEAEDLRAALDKRQAEAEDLRVALDERQAEAEGLRTALDKRQAEAEDLRAALDERQAKAEGLQACLADRQREAVELRDEIGRIHSSWTYRIGRTITWLPRRVRDGVRCYREHGIRYAVRRFLRHLTGWF